MRAPSIIIRIMSESLQKLGQWLDSYLNFEKLPQKDIFWLDTMEFLCAQFNHPEIFAPAFHVAGSKGKGSVSAMISSILDAGGSRTGLYTSPHIIDFAERIGIAHSRLPEKTYADAASELMDGIGKIPAESFPGKRPTTWFELVTLYAMIAFRQAKVDYSVYEVGLGGRLDATNVITPKISVITPIELEHTEFLGDTVEKIAAEKGGIIKRNVPVVVAPQQESVRDVFRTIAKERGSEIRFIDEIVSSVTHRFEGNSMFVKIESPLFRRPLEAKMRLLGEVQAMNAALAAAAVKIALPKTDEAQIEMGLSVASLPGRFEVVDARRLGFPCAILDGAHTVNSERFTMETYRALFGGRKDGTLLFGCAADKDSADIAPLFAGNFSDVFVTRPGTVKKSDIGEMERSFSRAGIPFTADEDFCAMIKAAVSASARKNAPLLVTGSFYLVSEVRKLLGI